MFDRAKANPVIQWRTGQRITGIRGGTGRGPVPSVAGLQLADVSSGAETSLAVDALFLAIGHDPQTALLRGKVACDADGYLLVNERQETSVPGIFAAGDCHDRRYRQAITAAAMGCRAALEVERFLARNDIS
jgi:thioredoxin reductase (NADPH)